MLAKITHSFRMAEKDGTRKYTPGDVAEGRAAEISIENGWGKVLSAAEKKEIAAKADKAAPKNKAKSTAPENKAG